MLQSLLADRFKLKIRRETRDMPVYELVVGKNGPKFKESARDASPNGHLAVIGRNYELTMSKATMDDLADQIANTSADRAVLNKTGLTGTYDIRMVFTPSFRMNREEQSDWNDISIFNAVQDQLGLKLQARKAMVEIVVVDHVEKPSEN